ncbi:MAG TPA: TlpA disulfide reductase family protein [Thermoanaerobaculia bacterium]|nr:TlpA disulfide reductase family protein [Thermoanaerobaculia bacterium]
MGVVVWLAGAVPLAAEPSPAEPTDQHGRSHAWRGAAGQVTVLDFAASWCAPCWRTLPRLQELADRHPEVRFLVVSVDSDPAGRDRLVAELELRLPVLWDGERRIVEHFQPGAMPATVVLAADGEVLRRFEGSDPRAWRELVALVERLSRRAGPGGEGFSALRPLWGDATRDAPANARSTPRTALD